ncbi:hypothetical protein LZ31DRAFT_112598 [Colletotrichum somersetense]|nr:hypothetical protein LZ31DRAFT_112598 [Colletotrichum somersetense]
MQSTAIESETKRQRKTCALHNRQVQKWPTFPPTTYMLASPPRGSNRKRCTPRAVLTSPIGNGQKEDFDVGLIRTDAPEGTRFLVLRIRPLCHNARPMNPLLSGDVEIVLSPTPRRRGLPHAIGDPESVFCYWRGEPRCPGRSGEAEKMSEPRHSPVYRHLWFRWWAGSGQPSRPLAHLPCHSSSIVLFRSDRAPR